MLFDDVTIVIPTLNEAEAIGRVIEEVVSVGVPRERILVIDGRSTDGTADIARSMGVRVVVQGGYGKADAISTALLHVRTRYMLVMDGDYTYPAKYIPTLVGLAREGYDEVIGARKYLEQGSQGLIYRVGNRLLSSLFNLLFDTRISDVLSGMYVVNTELLRGFSLGVRGFSIEAAIAAHVATMGRITEVPIEYRRRIGDKKLGVSHGFSIFRDMVKLSLSYNPAFIILLIASIVALVGLSLGVYVGYSYIFMGIKYYLKGLVAIILFMTGVQLLSLSIVSLFIKRMEYRTQRMLRRIIG